MTAARYRPSDAECRCRLCGDRIVIARLWFDTVPPSGTCVEGARVVTDCAQAMARARAAAWLLRRLPPKAPSPG